MADIEPSSGEHPSERTWKQYPQSYVEGLEAEVERLREALREARTALYGWAKSPTTTSRMIDEVLGDG